MKNIEEFEKYYNEKGEVAILVSYGYGAGWSSWNYNNTSEYMATSKELVEMKLNEATESEVEQFLSDKFKGAHLCCLGWDDCKIVYIDKGTKFRITEYDGSEDLEIIGEIDYFVA